MRVHVLCGDGQFAVGGKKKRGARGGGGASECTVLTELISCVSNRCVCVCWELCVAADTSNKKAFKAADVQLETEGRR